MFDFEDSKWISEEKQTFSYDVGSASSAESDSDDLWKITTTGDTTQKIKTTSSGNADVSIGSATPGSITIGPNQESVQKLEALAREQLEKIDRLRDLIIDYISENEVSRQDKIRWKSDLDKIEDFKRRLKNGLSGQNSSMFIGELIGEEDILDPGELDDLNEIYRRWK